MKNAIHCSKVIAVFMIAFALTIALVTAASAAKPGGGGVSHTAKQTAPILLGTSGGWSYDLANGY